MAERDDEVLLPILQRAQALGFVGGDLHEHLEHAEGFVRSISAVASTNAGTTHDQPATFAGRGLDLGAGGGLPGLVLAHRFEAAHWVFLDANERRTAFLTDAVDALGWSDRVTVLRARAEDAAHAANRAAFDLVTARSFGPPAVVAECAAGFLRVGGALLVSEPPDADGSRWREGTQLRELGLAVEAASEAGYQALRQVEACPERYPRRSGMPAKRPLF